MTELQVLIEAECSSVYIYIYIYIHKRNRSLALSLEMYCTTKSTLQNQHCAMPGLADNYDTLPALDEIIIGSTEGRDGPAQFSFSLVPLQRDPCLPNCEAYISCFCTPSVVVLSAPSLGATIEQTLDNLAARYGERDARCIKALWMHAEYLSTVADDRGRDKLSDPVSLDGVPEW